MNLFDLTKKRVLVVGAAGDLGGAMLEGLLEAGARAVAVDISPKVTDFANKWCANGYEVNGLKVDIRNRDAIKASVRSTEDLLGGAVDILVNAAGIQRRAPSEVFTERDWDDVLSVNLTAGFLYSQEVSKGMIAQRSGKIIHVASIMSNFGGINIPAYSASKGGLVQLTKALSNDWASFGICVNAIAPGYIDTQLNTELVADDKRSNEVLLRTPARRWGIPSDMKGVTIFLASAASDFVTGTVITVDGGYSSR